MSEPDAALSSTTSLCPTCFSRVQGWYVTDDDGVYLTRTCSEHGKTRRKVWGSLDHWEWASEFGPTPSLGDSNRGVDDGRDPGMQVDNSHACLAVIDVTESCNLACSYCFASSGPGGREKSREEILDLLDVVTAGGGPRPVQFSGGEPTIRSDLPEIVESATERGFSHIEVNTNGLVLAREDGYADRLAEAGVTAIYLQFDGLEAETYEAIRDVDLMAVKREAIEACRRAGLPVILVPTLVPGINTHELEGIIQFALDNLDVVRSVNFQPVAHFGRYADEGERYSLDQVAETLAAQIDPLGPRDFMPVPCCSSYCQLATAVMPDGNGGIVPLAQFFDPELWDTVSGMLDESDWMELLAGTQTGEELSSLVAGCCGFELPGNSADCCSPNDRAETGCCGGDTGDLDPMSLVPPGMLEQVLPISITGFMDADVADLDRLSNCCITVPTPDGDLVPFCGYNMTTDDGQYALRNRNGWGGRQRVMDPTASPEEVTLHGTETGTVAEPSHVGEVSED